MKSYVLSMNFWSDLIIFLLFLLKLLCYTSVLLNQINIHFLMPIIFKIVYSTCKYFSSYPLCPSNQKLFLKLHFSLKPYQIWLSERIEKNVRKINFIDNEIKFEFYIIRRNDFPAVTFVKVKIHWYIKCTHQKCSRDIAKNGKRKVSEIKNEMRIWEFYLIQFSLNLM